MPASSFVPLARTRSQFVSVSEALASGEIADGDARLPMTDDSCRLPLDYSRTADVAPAWRHKRIDESTLLVVAKDASGKGSNTRP